jgi:hypothetical protein
LTKVLIDDILYSMRTLENVQGNDIALIYAGLGQISGRGRKTLKDIARTLVLAQNNPGYPIYQSIGQQIMGESRTPGVPGGNSGPGWGVQE